MNTDTKKQEKMLYLQSETIDINRSDIHFAAYNPRKENQKVVDELRKNFKKVGFLGGIVWNKTTGNLVGGHKRIQAMDIINKYDGTKETDYKVKVEMVEFDLKTEMEQNVFLNNKKVQGEMDYKLLSVMVSEGIEIHNCGLDNDDLQMLTALVPNFEIGNSEHIQKDMELLNKPTEERKEQIKQLKKDIKDNIFKDQRVSYVSISFDSWENKCEFMERFGFNSDDLFIKGELFNDMIERID